MLYNQMRYSMMRKFVINGLAIFCCLALVAACGNGEGVEGESVGAYTGPDDGAGHPYEDLSDGSWDESADEFGEGDWDGDDEFSEGDWDDGDDDWNGDDGFNSGEPTDPGQNDSEDDDWEQNQDDVITDPADELVSDLSDADAAALCSQIEADFEAAYTDEAGCSISMMFVAAFDPDPVGYCEDNWDDCINEEGDFAGGDEVDDDDSCNLEEIDRSSCDATVDEIVACHDEQIDGMETLDSDFQCSALESPSQEIEDAVANVMMAGPACQALESGCEEYLPDSDDGGL